MAIDLDFTHIVNIYVDVIYARMMGTAYFDNAFAAKSEGGIVYSYDNNYPVMARIIRSRRTRINTAGAWAASAEVARAAWKRMMMQII